MTVSTTSPSSPATPTGCTPSTGRSSTPRCPGTNRWTKGCGCPVDIGKDRELNVFEVKGNTEWQRQTPMFGRGRLDHIGLQAASLEAFDTIRERLIARGSTDGFVTDFGPVLSLFFVDPDGLEAEVCVPNPKRATGGVPPAGHTGRRLRPGQLTPPAPEHRRRAITAARADRGLRSEALVRALAEFPGVDGQHQESRTRRLVSAQRRGPAGVVPPDEEVQGVREGPIHGHRPGEVACTARSTW